MLELALNIATLVHYGQVDKAGQPYIEHPKYVASLVYNENEKIVALLHDVVEDTAMTMEDIARYGFDTCVIEALALLTHKKEVEYFDYVNKIKDNDLARAVKIADLTHNSDISRLKEPNQEDFKRIYKYKKALNILISKI